MKSDRYTFPEFEPLGFHTVITTRLWGSINPFTSYEALTRLSSGLCIPEDAISTRIVFPEEIHGDIVHRCVDSDGGSIRLQADGLVSDSSRLMLCAYSADCLPILMASPHPRSYGVVHAGWKGLVKNVVGNAVDSLCSLGAKRSKVVAGIGPGICSQCYEIRDDLVSTLSALTYDRFILSEGERTTLDLAALGESRLIEAGIAPDNIHRITECTACGNSAFFSARKREADEERGASFASVIWPCNG